MIAGEEKDRDATGGQAVNALGKFSLLGRAWLTTLVGITTEESQVNPVLQSIIYHLVKGG
ncbi:hypothetical protein ES703_76222 [subsurface metagenome]